MAPLPPGEGPSRRRPGRIRAWLRAAFFVAGGLLVIAWGALEAGLAGAAGAAGAVLIAASFGRDDG